MAKQKQPANKTRDWIIRIVIFGTLGVVLVLAYLDNQKKQQATQTGEAWRDLLKVANDKDFGHLPEEKLKDALVGSPEISENDNQNVYTWKGSFRSYTIRVNFEKGVGHPVSDIEGP